MTTNGLPATKPRNCHDHCYQDHHRAEDVRRIQDLPRTSVKDLIAQLEGVEPDGEIYDAKVQVLSEYVEHRVKEEQNEMFPKAKTTSLDLVELGARMAARKAELIAPRG